MPARAVLEGVFWILNAGAQWPMLPQWYPNYSTVHRRFQPWCEREVLCNILVDLANAFREEGELDERESFLDATFSPAKGGGEEIGWSRRGEEVKILAMLDRGGLPVSVSTHAANHHAVRCVQLCFDFCMLEAKPEKPFGDKDFDSARLDAELAKEGVGVVAPHRSGRRILRTRDGRSLRRYARRWIVERFFARLQWKRRLRIRWEYYASNFLGFVQPGCITMLLRRF